MKEKEVIITKLNETLNKPGGKMAVRFILNSLGAFPFISGITQTSINIWGEKNQESFNDKITEWLENPNADLLEIMKKLKSELNESTKANFSLLLGEALGIEIPFMIQSGNILEVFTLLNPQTLSEFDSYQHMGWITIIPHSNSNSNINNNHIEDKKRPWGMKNSFTIRLNESYYT